MSDDPSATVAPEPEPVPDNITVIEIQEEMETSFLDYAMSVIISRALPDARDGLKPVHRRILWSMYDQNFRPDRVHVKCARVVGDVMARFHPHGDTAIYDALARMAQPFSLRHPLIDFHGNYGSPEDRPAAARYTESRLAPLAMRMLDDIDQDTVDFIDNYSGEFEEPAVLPSRFPNLLVNGSQGIAVGMATNIPPHNLGEVIDAVDHLIVNPDATAQDLAQFVKGPDFPTGGTILGRQGIASAYETGKGSIKMRAKVDFEEIRPGRNAIVVSEMPYQISAGAVGRKIADLVNAREIEGIAAVNDESAGDTTRFVIELKRDSNPSVVLNNLWKQTPLQSTFSVNMVALVDGVPRTLNLRDALVAYVSHQIEVIRRRSEYRLAEAERRLHIVDGLLKALDLIDQIITTIRGSADRGAARGALMAEPFEFSEVQATHILDMTLGRLTRLGRDELESEQTVLAETISGLQEILGDELRLHGVIRAELAEIRSEFAEERRSTFDIDPGEINIEDLIDDEDLVFTMSSSGYVKVVSATEFKTQSRGGRGVTGANLKDEDTVVNMMHTSAHAYLLFFSNRGKVYRLKAHQLPMAGRTARGTHLSNLLPLEPEEIIEAVIDTRDYETNRYLFFATRQGRVKKTLFNAYDSSLKAGLIAIKLNDGDELVEVMPVNEEDDIFLVSKSGQTIRFSEAAVRSMGRTAAGVKGMRFRGDDELVSCAVGGPGEMLVHVTSAGFGKRSDPSEFARKGRGGLGVRGIRTREERGVVVGAFFVTDEDEIILIGDGGTVIRMSASDISLQGRSASGVRIMAVQEGRQIAAASRVPPSTDDEVDGELDDPLEDASESGAEALAQDDPARAVEADIDITDSPDDELDEN